MKENKWIWISINLTKEWKSTSNDSLIHLKGISNIICSKRKKYSKMKMNISS